MQSQDVYHYGMPDCCYNESGRWNRWVVALGESSPFLLSWLLLLPLNDHPMALSHKSNRKSEGQAGPKWGKRHQRFPAAAAYREFLQGLPVTICQQQLSLAPKRVTRAFAQLQLPAYFLASCTSVSPLFPTSLASPSLHHCLCYRALCTTGHLTLRSAPPPHQSHSRSYR